MNFSVSDFVHDSLTDTLYGESFERIRVLIEHVFIVGCDLCQMSSVSDDRVLFMCCQCLATVLF